MTEEVCRCWVCGKLLKEIDIWTDLCNRCSDCKTDPKTKPLEEKPCDEKATNT